MSNAVLQSSKNAPVAIGSKRPRRQNTMNKNYIDESKDPYIYTSGIVQRGTNRRRKLQEDQQQHQEIQQDNAKINNLKRNRLGITASVRRPMNLPPADFGARLFANLKGDSESSE